MKREPITNLRITLSAVLTILPSGQYVTDYLDLGGVQATESRYSNNDGTAQQPWIREYGDGKIAVKPFETPNAYLVVDMAEAVAYLEEYVASVTLLPMLEEEEA